MDIKASIKAAQDIYLAPLSIEEWGVDVFLRKWKGGERVKFMAWFNANKENGELDARVVALSLADDQGNRIYSDKEIPELLDKNAEVLHRISLTSLKHNGIYKEDDKEDSPSFPPTE